MRFFLFFFYFKGRKRVGAISAKRSGGIGHTTCVGLPLISADFRLLLLFFFSKRKKCVLFFESWPSPFFSPRLDVAIAIGPSEEKTRYTYARTSLENVMQNSAKTIGS